MEQARDERQGGRMMSGHMGGMMFGMGLLWVIAIVVLVLATAALVKYLFFND